MAIQIILLVLSLVLLATLFLIKQLRQDVKFLYDIVLHLILENIEREIKEEKANE